jgi:copper chaperone
MLMEQYELDVEGMSCTGCEENVTNAVKRVDGVHRVTADHETGGVEVTGEEGTEDSVKQAIHDAGFDVSA